MRELRLPSTAVETDPKPELGFEVPPSAYPLHPVEQIPFQGARHGFLNTTTGGLVFRMEDFGLPGRMPIDMGRVYDSKFTSSLPPPPLRGPQEVRWTQDLGDNWILAYAAYLIPDGVNYIMATPEGDLIRWLYQGTQVYARDDEAPSRHMTLLKISATQFVETQMDGTKWTYTSGVVTGSLALTKIEDRSGNKIELTYQAGYLKLIKNSENAYVNINRPMFVTPPPAVDFPTMRVTSLTDNTGRQVSFSYNSVGRLTSVTDVRGYNWPFTYDGANNKLASATAPTGGIYLNLSYDALSRVFGFEADAGPWTVEYQTNFHRTLLKDAFNNTWQYEYDSLTGITNHITEPTGGIHHLTFDANNNPIGYSGPEGISASWTYDALHRPLTYSPPGAGTNHITYTYHSKHWVNNVTSLEGGLTTFVRHQDKGFVLEETTPDGAKWTATYATNGDRLTLRLPKGNVPGAVDDYQWGFAYNAFGNLTQATDPTGRIFQFDYTSHGDLWKLRRPDRFENGQIVNVEWRYDRNAKGDITAVTDPLNATWTRTYDTAGRLTGIDGPAGTHLRYAYDARFRITGVTIGDDPSDPTTTYAYDGAGRLITKTVPTGSIWTYGYDGSSRLVSTMDPLTRTWTYERDLAGKVEALTYPGGQEVTMQRDAAGRLTQRTVPGGRVEAFTYDIAGRLTMAEADVNDGEWVGGLAWDYDSMGRPTSLTTYVNEGETERSRELQFTYDPNGNRGTLSSIGTGESLTFSYDELDRLTGTNSSIYDDWTVAYHAHSGHRAQVQTGSRWKSWTYNPGGQLIHEQWNWPDHENGDHTYTRDLEGRVISDHDAVADVTREVEFGVLGLPSLLEETVESVLTTTASTYDTAGQLVEILRTEGSQQPVQSLFEWDTAGRLTLARQGDRIRMYTWDDTPDDTSAALALWRAPTAPDEPTAEVLYDYDGRISRIVSHSVDESEPYLSAEYRWAPLLMDRALWATEIQEDESYDMRWLAHDIGGYYSELTASFADSNPVHPILASDLTALTLREFHGSAMPDPVAPFGVGAWGGIAVSHQQAQASALADFVTGLIEGRIEKTATTIKERRESDTLASFDSLRPGARDLSDGWLGLALRSGRKEEILTSLSDRPQSGVNELIRSPDPVQNSWFQEHGACQGEGCITDDLCLCPWAAQLSLSSGPGHSGCPPCGGGGGFNYGVCDFTYSQPAGYPESLNSPDISEHGVSLVNGEFTERVTDLVVFDAGGDIEFSRTYRSGVKYEGDLGYKWVHNWTEFLSIGSDPTWTQCGNLVRWVMPDGRFIEFWFDGGGVPNNPPESRYRIRKVQTSFGQQYEIRHVSGSIRRFNTQGRLLWISEGASALSLTYYTSPPSLDGKLWKVSSNAGVRLIFTYDSSGERLMSVESGLSAADRVDFEYNACKELKTIRRPVTTLGYDKNGQLLPSGSARQPATRYTYWNIFSNPDMCDSTAAGMHMLTKIEVDQHNPLVTTGPTITETVLQNIYYTTGTQGGNGYNYLKVQAQCVGNKATCPLAGDVDISYEYELGGDYPHAALIHDHRTGQEITEKHSFYNESLMEVIEDLGPNRLNRKSSYLYANDLPIRRTFPDGSCELTQYRLVGGVWLPQVTTRRVKPRCIDVNAAGSPDQITVRTYETYGGRVRSITGPEAFPDGQPPSNDFDPTDPEFAAFKKYAQFFYYDYDEGYPSDLTQICNDWGLGTPPPTNPSLNGDSGDNLNWYGNLVKEYRWVPGDGTRPDGELANLFTYTSTGRLKTKVAPGGVKTKVQYYVDATGAWDWRQGHPEAGLGSGSGPIALVTVAASDDSLPLKTRYAWSVKKRLLASQDPQGRRLNRDHAASGQVLLEEVTCDPCTPAGEVLRSTQYTYDLRGRLLREATRESTSGPFLSSRWTTYDNLGRPITMTVDPDPTVTPGEPGTGAGNPPPLHLLAKTFYDGRGRVIKQVSPERRVSCATYDALNRVISSRRQFTLEASNPELWGPSCSQSEPDGPDIVTSTIYDAMNRVVIQQDDSGVKTYQWHDLHGRPEYVSDGKPEAVSFSDIVFLGTPPSEPPASKWYAQTSYDSASRPMRQRFLGRQNASDGNATGSDFMQVTWQEYDSLGRPITSHVGLSEGFVPAAAANSTTPPTGSIPNFALATSRSYYDLNGRLWKTLDPMSRETNYEYDSLGRPIKTLLPTQSTFRDTHEVLYDEWGRQKETESTIHQPGGGSQTRMGTVDFDKWGRVWHATGIVGTDQENLLTEYAYDSLGRVELMAQRWAAAPPSLPYLDDNDRAIETVYDRAGRMVERKVRHAPGAWTSTKYSYDKDGLVKFLTDAKNNQTSWIRSSGLAQVDRMLYPIVNNEQQTIEYANYDGNGRPLQIQFRKDNSESSLRLTWDLDYDERGRLESRSATLPTGAEAPEFFGSTVQEFEYDDLGRLKKAIDKSPLSFSSVPNIYAEFAYDSAGRKIEENQRLPLNNDHWDHRVESIYAVDGFRTSLIFPGIDPDRYTISYQADALGRLEQVRGPGDPSIATSSPSTLAHYSFVGEQVHSNAYGNGTELEMTYDGLGRVKAMAYEVPNPVHEMMEFRYGYDRVGNLTYEQRIHEQIDPEPNPTYRTRAYTTDLMGRLAHWSDLELAGASPAISMTEPSPADLSAPRSDAEKWSLDLLGNWSSHSRGPEAIPPADTFVANALNQYESIDPAGAEEPTNFDYDWLGQMREDEAKGRSYVWDAFGRLTKVINTVPETDTVIAQYRYDALNRRVEKYVPSPVIGEATTRYVYDGWRAIEERVVALNPDLTLREDVSARYGFGLGLDQILWMDRDVRRNPLTFEPDPFDGTIDEVIDRFYVHHDLKGNAVVVTDDPSSGSANEVERFTYSEYGEMTAWWDAEAWDGVSYGPPSNVSQVGLPYLYTGQRFDFETELHYYKNRYYDPTIGRFLRRDLIGYADGPNLYSYANSNPSVRTDPLGLVSLEQYYRSGYQYFENRASTLTGSCTGLSVRWKSCGDRDAYFRQKDQEQGNVALSESDYQDGKDQGYFSDHELVAWWTFGKRGLILALNDPDKKKFGSFFNEADNGSIIAIKDGEWAWGARWSDYDVAQAGSGTIDDPYQEYVRVTPLGPPINEEPRWHIGSRRTLLEASRAIDLINAGRYGASDAARALRQGSSMGAIYLNEWKKVARFAKNPLVRYAGYPVAVTSTALDVSANMQQEVNTYEAVADPVFKTTVTAAAVGIGVALGCGGIGVLPCIAGAIGGGLAGGVYADWFSDLVFGHDKSVLEEVP